MDIEAASDAAEAGADFLGIVFAPSRRRISPEKGKELTEAIRGLKNYPLLVGVFVNAPQEEVNATAELCHLDYVQISGDESWRYCRNIRYPIIKVIHIGDDTQPEQVLNEITMGVATPLKQPPLFLLDTKSDRGGGCGTRFDWEVAAEVTARYPVIVAGGLNAENVDELIKNARPWGVDTSSGVECNGVKDAAKVKEFIEAVRRADSHGA
jgi:phosphoribosylanthranilate isomerase